MNKPYTCTECGKVLKDVKVVEFRATDLVASVGWGVGVGFLVSQFVSRDFLSIGGCMTF